MNDWLRSVFFWIESTPIGLWVRESVWGFPLSLIVHAWSMALLVGICMVLALGVLLLPRLLPPLLNKSVPVIWFAFTVSLLSGLFLLSAYPAKALTNEVFYLKLGFITLALWLALSLITQCRTQYFAAGTRIPTGVKLKASGILLAWFGTIIAGRLLAYTYSILSVAEWAI
jgi:hypothetical protein